MDHSYTLREAKAQLSALLDQVAAGEAVEIVRKGGKRDRFRILLIEGEARLRQPGALKGAIRIGDGFDDEDEELTAAFEGRM